MRREDKSMPAGGASQFQAEPFSVHMDRVVLDDLRARIRSTRLPEAGTRRVGEHAGERLLASHWA
jgi:hypothetical protein